MCARFITILTTASGHTLLAARNLQEIATTGKVRWLPGKLSQVEPVLVGVKHLPKTPSLEVSAAPGKCFTRRWQPLETRAAGKASGWIFAHYR